MESADPDRPACNAGRCAVGWLLVRRTMSSCVYAEHQSYLRNTTVCRRIPRRQEDSESGVLNIGR